MTGLVLSCEHASWALPPGVDLGVPRELVRSQAGWDHGALEIANHISEAVGIGVHTGLFSRMFVDLNRPPGHIDCIPKNSFGVPVPANVTLSPADAAERIATFHAPYWESVRREVSARLHDRGSVLHLSIHTFDPELDPPARAFEVGVLYEPNHAFEADLSERLLFQLRAAGIAVRANQPYNGVGPAICTSFREERAGQRYAGIQLETSYAVTHTPDGCARIAAAVVPFLESL